MKIYISAILVMATIALCAQEINDNTEKWSSGRPDGHAPISVMGDHMHGKGEWMFSYRYMYMNMDELKQGTDNASYGNALENYMVTPTSMPMNMHMLGTMFAPSDKITLMAMINYITMEMEHINRMGGTFTTETEGFGDVQLSVLYKFFNANLQSLHAQLGFSIPTGGISESDITPASAPNETELPYPMQLGSGTFDTNLALTYLGQSNSVSWGSQVRGLFRFGKNDREYRLGNRYSWNNWFAVKTTDWLSFSARLEGLAISKIEGADPNLNPMMVITVDTSNSGGTLVNSGIGFNLYVPTGALKNLRFGFEWAMPLFQDVNGIQLRTKESVTLETQYSF
ncbi:transporter [Muricauda sp. ANG21]|uniref:transporter n=1 Tax=Allomuricauda sp. ANG21 TaxID=3042468 RepID=UPI003455F246